MRIFPPPFSDAATPPIDQPLYASLHAHLRGSAPGSIPMVGQPPMLPRNRSTRRESTIFGPMFCTHGRELGKCTECDQRSPVPRPVNSTLGGAMGGTMGMHRVLQHTPSPLQSLRRMGQGRTPPWLSACVHGLVAHRCRTCAVNTTNLTHTMTKNAMRHRLAEPPSSARRPTPVAATSSALQVPSSTPKAAPVAKNFQFAHTVHEQDGVITIDLTEDEMDISVVERGGGELINVTSEDDPKSSTTATLTTTDTISATDKISTTGTISTTSTNSTAATSSTTATSSPIPASTSSKSGESASKSSDFDFSAETAAEIVDSTLLNDDMAFEYSYSLPYLTEPPFSADVDDDNFAEEITPLVAAGESQLGSDPPLSAGIGLVNGATLSSADTLKSKTPVPPQTPATGPTSSQSPSRDLRADARSTPSSKGEKPSSASQGNVPADNTSKKAIPASSLSAASSQVPGASAEQPVELTSDDKTGTTTALAPSDHNSDASSAVHNAKPVLHSAETSTRLGSPTQRTQPGSPLASVVIVADQGTEPVSNSRVGDQPSSGDDGLKVSIEERETMVSRHDHDGQIRPAKSVRATANQAAADTSSDAVREAKSRKDEPPGSSCFTSSTLLGSSSSTEEVEEGATRGKSGSSLLPVTTHRPPPVAAMEEEEEDPLEQPDDDCVRGKDSPPLRQSEDNSSTAGEKRKESGSSRRTNAKRQKQPEKETGEQQKDNALLMARRTPMETKPSSDAKKVKVSHSLSSAVLAIDPRRDPKRRRKRQGNSNSNNSNTDKTGVAAPSRTDENAANQSTLESPIHADIAGAGEAAKSGSDGTSSSSSSPSRRSDVSTRSLTSSPPKHSSRASSSSAYKNTTNQNHRGQTDAPLPSGKQTAGCPTSSSSLPGSSNQNATAATTHTKRARESAQQVAPRRGDGKSSSDSGHSVSRPANLDKTPFHNKKHSKGSTSESVSKSASGDNNKVVVSDKVHGSKKRTTLAISSLHAPVKQAAVDGIQLDDGGKHRPAASSASSSLGNDGEDETAATDVPISPVRSIRRVAVSKNNAAAAGAAVREEVELETAQAAPLSEMERLDRKLRCAICIVAPRTELMMWCECKALCVSCSEAVMDRNPVPCVCKVAGGGPKRRR